jgi:hypothetical protein
VLFRVAQLDDNAVLEHVVVYATCPGSNGIQPAAIVSRRVPI